MKTLILKLEHNNQAQASVQGLKISKIVSSISPANFIKLMRDADNKVNPRTATIGKITKSIYETLETSSSLFWFKTKGLLLATESCEILDRNRIKISLDSPDFEGIMDGGHNALAIGAFLLDKLCNHKVKSWEDCKKYWDVNYDDIVQKFDERSAEFDFSIPVEIIFPNGEDGSDVEFYDNISEICAARNNNVQLKETAKGNKVGFYDYLKEVLTFEFDVVWKTGESGNIHSEDVISLSVLPLMFLRDKGLLPSDVKSISKVSVYSQKGKCIEFFNDVLAHEDVSKEEKGTYKIHDERLMSALSLTKDILYFFDRLYVEFPNLYHKAAPGRFGRISIVKMKKSKAPFGTIAKASDYQYPFGYFYPLVTGLTSLMRYDEVNDRIEWRINPRNLDLNRLDLSQYVELIKMVNFDPQKVGKGTAFYNQAEAIFEKI